MTFLRLPFFMVPLLLSGGMLFAQPPAKLPDVFDKVKPESLDDLRAIEKQVEKIVEKVTPCTVCVQFPGSSGSGVIVSKDGYVLTAGHVSGQPGRDVTLVLHDGRKVKGKTLGRNQGIDSGMVKIIDPGDWPFVEQGTSADLKAGQWCLALGHPGGYRTGRAPVVRLGRILRPNVGGLVHDCTIVGGDSGGPLFDMNGKVIGIHSRITQSIQGNISVPIDTFRETWDRLAKGESWGGSRPPVVAVPNPGGQTPWLGVTGGKGNEGCPLTQVVPGSPADKAGVKAGDIIRSADGNKIQTIQELSGVVRGKKPGDELALEIKRGDEDLKLKVLIAANDMQPNPNPNPGVRPNLRLGVLGGLGALGGLGGLRPGIGQLPRMPQQGNLNNLGGLPGLPDLNKLIPNLPQGGNPDANRAGVYLGLAGGQSDEGCPITRVGPGSPAEQAGIKVGDLVLSVDGQPIKTFAELSALVKQRNVGDEMTLDLKRADMKLKVKVKVGLQANGQPIPLPPSEGRKGVTLGIKSDPEAKTCVVMGLEPGSPALKAGVKIGDVIRRVEGQKIENVDELSEALGKKKPGDEVDLEIVRNGESLIIRVTIGN